MAKEKPIGVSLNSRLRTIDDEPETLPSREEIALKAYKDGYAQGQIDSYNSHGLQAKCQGDVPASILLQWIHNLREDSEAATTVDERERTANEALIYSGHLIEALVGWALKDQVGLAALWVDQSREGKKACPIESVDQIDQAAFREDWSPEVIRVFLANILDRLGYGAGEVFQDLSVELARLNWGYAGSLLTKSHNRQDDALSGWSFRLKARQHFEFIRALRKGERSEGSLRDDDLVLVAEAYGKTPSEVNNWMMAKNQPSQTVWPNMERKLDEARKEADQVNSGEMPASVLYGGDALIRDGKNYQDWLKAYTQVVRDKG